MSSRFVNPFTDLGFKIIFGQPASKDLLIILLNELLSGEHHIEDLTFLDKEDRSENIHDKGIIYDLYCRTSTSEYIIVEMQNRWHSHFLDRTLYYVCRAVSRQMENPSSKEVCVPDTSLEGGLRPAQGRRGFLRSPLQASCCVRRFPDEFQGGWSGKQVPYRHGGFRPGQRSCGEPEFPSDLSPVSLFYEGTGRMFYFIR